MTEDALYIIYSNQQEANMTELFQDIETLKDVLIAWEEGASDEKRAARHSLIRMLARKEHEAAKFEADVEDMFDNVPV